MSHYFNRTTCENCEKDAIFAWKDPSISKLGWFGGCGSINCTGLWNAIVHDHDGTFFGPYFNI